MIDSLFNMSSFYTCVWCGCVLFFYYWSYSVFCAGVHLLHFNIAMLAGECMSSWWVLSAVVSNNHVFSSGAERKCNEPAFEPIGVKAGLSCVGAEVHYFLQAAID